MLMTNPANTVDLRKPQLPQAPRKSRLSAARKLILQPMAIPVAGVIVLGALIAWSASRPKSPVPIAITRDVNFPIYYPDQKKLPAGYTLNAKSFSTPRRGVVLYAVDYGNGNKLVFSVQQKPSDNDIQTFYANYLPLRNHWQVSLGGAEFGARNATKDQLQSVVSLPVTNDNSWLLITSPYDVNQDQLKQVLQSLKK